MREKMLTATPADAKLLQLLPGQSYEGVQVTSDQMRHLRKVYGFTDEVMRAFVEESRKQHEAAQRAVDEENAKKKSWQPKVNNLPPFSEKAVYHFAESGEAINLFRHVKHDGLRLMAFLALYLEPDEDPVRLVARLLVAAGWEVDPEVYDWVEQEVER